MSTLPPSSPPPPIPPELQPKPEAVRAKGDEMASAMAGWAIGLNFAYSVVGGGLLGWLIQRYIKPDWAPWPLVAGLLLGLVGGFTRFVRQALAANRG